MNDKLTYRLVDEETWERCLRLAEDPGNEYEETDEIVKNLKEARRTPAETVSREAIDLESAEKLARQTDYAIEAMAVDGHVPINWADAGAFFLEGYQYSRKTLPATQPVSTGEVCRACGRSESEHNGPFRRCAPNEATFVPQASRPHVPSVPECWELLAKVHTIAAMNDGGLPGETMREMKAALEAYPEYRQAAADPRDVVLPWSELMDLIAYFNTVGDKRAEAMLRGLKSVPSVAVVPSVFAEVQAELERAMAKFPTWPTDPLHAVAVLGEEFGELTKDVLQSVYEPHKTSRENVQKEAIQTAAMALRFIASLDKYEYQAGEQHAHLLTSQPDMGAVVEALEKIANVKLFDSDTAREMHGIALAAIKGGVK